MKMIVEKTDDDRERMMSLISAMKVDGQITLEQFMEVRVVFGFFFFSGSDLMFINRIEFLKNICLFQLIGIENLVF